MWFAQFLCFSCSVCWISIFLENPFFYFSSTFGIRESKHARTWLIISFIFYYYEVFINKCMLCFESRTISTPNNYHRGRLSIMALELRMSFKEIRLLCWLWLSLTGKSLKNLFAVDFEWLVSLVLSYWPKLTVSWLILLAWNITEIVECVQFIIISAILAGNALSFHCQRLQYKDNISVALAFHYK